MPACVVFVCGKGWQWTEPKRPFPAWPWVPMWWVVMPCCVFSRQFRILDRDWLYNNSEFRERVDFVDELKPHDVPGKCLMSLIDLQMKEQRSLCIWNWKSFRVIETRCFSAHRCTTWVFIIIIHYTSIIIHYTSIIIFYINHYTSHH